MLGTVLHSASVCSNEHLKTVKNGRIVLCSCHFILPGKMTVRKLYANKMKTNKWKYTASGMSAIFALNTWHTVLVIVKYTLVEISRVHRERDICEWLGNWIHKYHKMYHRCFAIRARQLTLWTGSAVDAFMPLTAALTRNNFRCEHRLAHGPNKMLIISSGFS